ncbi:hypothetical protein D9M71_474260 [compost metagenome]
MYRAVASKLKPSAQLLFQHARKGMVVDGFARDRVLLQQRYKDHARLEVVADQAADDGLGYRLQQMQRVRLHTVEVLLRNHLALMKHQKTIGVAIGQEGRQIGLLAVDPLETYVVQ